MLIVRNTSESCACACAAPLGDALIKRMGVWTGPQRPDDERSRSATPRVSRGKPPAATSGSVPTRTNRIGSSTSRYRANANCICAAARASTGVKRGAALTRAASNRPWVDSAQQSLPRTRLLL